MRGSTRQEKLSSGKLTLLKFTQEAAANEKSCESFQAFDKTTIVVEWKNASHTNVHLFTAWAQFPLFSQGIKFNIPRSLSNI